MHNSVLFKRLMTLYLGVYFIVNLLTLTVYPFIHSDEPWLAGLSKAYMEKQSLFVTEPFFNLMPRYPHAIKSLFHGLQSLFITIFGYNIMAVRLISLVTAILILIIMYNYLSQLFRHKLIALLSVILFSLNIQYLYASHFARQEILILLVLVLSYTVYRSHSLNQKIKVFLVPFIIGASIGIHPNAFIVATMIGLLYLYDWLKDTTRIKSLIIYISGLSIWAMLYIGISLLGNSNFFTDYWAYGTTHSVDAPISGRFQNFIDFYIKLYNQISGTYYLPNIKSLFILFLILIIITIALFILKRRLLPLNSGIIDSLLMIIGFNGAIFIIGRFNPTSILFIIFPLFLLMYHLLSTLKLNSALTAFILSVGIILSINLILIETKNSQINDYASYINHLSSSLSKDSIVLGNLSGGFAYNDSVFYDIRNLYFLDDMTLSDYIIKYKINTIVYYEEYDYIHRNKQWQILYGSDTSYYDALQTILTKYGTVIHQFEDPQYGNRIVRYMDGYPWKVTVYDIRRMY